VNPSIYIQKICIKNTSSIIAIYVDDILITGNNTITNKIKLKINKNFELYDIREVVFIIGIIFIKC
jgi:hypothetical protein